MMAAHHEDVPGNVGSVSVTEFITSEGDLSLPSLPHGMSPQFIFPPDPSPAGEIFFLPLLNWIGFFPLRRSWSYCPATGSPGNDPAWEGGRLQQGGVGLHAGAHHLSSIPIHTHQPPYVQGGRKGGGTSRLDTHARCVKYPSNHCPEQYARIFYCFKNLSMIQVSSHSSPDTPGKKERNSRKQCPYCHKDFHEMSLKRHTKDAHFRNQNTYFICPQWKGCQRKQSVTNNTGININRHCFKQSHPL